MIDPSFKEMSIRRLFEIIEAGKQCGSISVPDFEDLIIEKYQLLTQSEKDFIQERGGWGFIDDVTMHLRVLLMQRGLYGN